MLTIQSFLLKLRNVRIIRELKKNMKYALLILGYAFIAVILVLKFDVFHLNQEHQTMEAFAAQKITVAMEEAPVLSEMEYLDRVFMDSSLLGHQTIYNPDGTRLGQMPLVSMDIFDGDLVSNKVKSAKKTTVKSSEKNVDKPVTTSDKKSKSASKEEAAKSSKEATETMNTDVAVLSLSSKEIEILQRIVEAEATGEDLKGKILVANVIMNRVNNSSFPDSVEEVVFQKTGGSYQFSPIKDKRYYSVKVSDATKEAVQRVIQGEDYSQGALYFSARKRASKANMNWFDNHLKRLFQHGNHEFFTNK